MSKSEMANYIKTAYKGMLQIILLAQLDYLKNGKFYGWNIEGKKFRIINNKGNFAIEGVV